MDQNIESVRHKESVRAHLEKRAICLKEFDRLVREEKHNGKSRSSF